MRKAILDFDDLCDTNDPYEALLRLKARDDAFRVTLFAIPTRCGDAILAKYAAIRDWCALGVHGWRHARHECLGWTSEQTEDKLQRSLAIYPHFARIFKAPNWEIHDEAYAGCKAAGFAIADHIRNIEILPRQPHYIYNLRLRDDKYSRHHGHIQPLKVLVGDKLVPTGLTEEPDAEYGINPAYLLPVGTAYAFCTEAVTTDKGVAI